MDPPMTASTGWRTVHLFVSSTFNDMHAERDHLRHVVLPELTERLRPRRVHLQLVDLRWGVSTLSIDDEAEREREILRYCLDEVDRCRPFMLVLLGERHGYVPDESLLGDAAGRLGRAAAELRRMSVTELEVEAGLLAGTGDPSGLRVFLRRPFQAAALPAERLRAISDRAAGRAESAAAVDAQRQRLRELAPGRCHDYALEWEATTGLFTGLTAFGEAVREALWTDLDLYTRPVAPGAAPASQEQWQDTGTAELIEQRRITFVGRQALLDRLLRFCQDEDRPATMLLAGASGAGKTSVAAARRASGRGGGRAAGAGALPRQQLGVRRRRRGPARIQRAVGRGHRRRAGVARR
jgi:hypothetical protein